MPSHNPSDNPQNFKRYLSTMGDAELAKMASHLKDKLAIGGDLEGSEIAVIAMELKVALEEMTSRGMKNPLATPDPIAPPPIPGVTMPAPTQRAPLPPLPPLPNIPKVPHPATAPPGVTVTSSKLASGQIPQPSMPLPGQISKPSVPRAERTCKQCPAFVKASDTEKQLAIFGKAMGLPMCATLHIPLATMNSTDDQNAAIQANFGSICGFYGVMDSNPSDVEKKRYRIAYGNEQYTEKILKELSGKFPKPAQACTSCTFYKSPERMLTDLGIPQAACTMHGKLIPLGKAKETAEACLNKREDFDHTAANDVIWKFIVPYKGNITVIDAGEPVSDSRAKEFDPTAYLTDKPVSAEDESYGIRAWQKLMDPEKNSKRFVYMPIFDRGSFPKDEQAKIPVAGTTAEDDHPELYEDHHGLLYTAVVLWTKLHETPALNGIAGTGKTEFFRYAAWRMQLPFNRFSITNSTELDELQGRMSLVATETGNKTEFTYGRVSLAWGQRCVLCVDEPNTGPNDVWQFFRPLTDNSKQLVLDVNNGERLERNKYCFMGMAFNPSWDMRNVGTHEIGDADGSRLMHISVPMPSEAQERNIIKRRCELDEYKIPKETLDAIMGIAKELRELASQDAFPVHWGLRNQIKVARATAWFPMERAYRLAAGDLLDPQYCDQLLVMVKSYTPGDNTVAEARRGPGRPRSRRV